MKQYKITIYLEMEDDESPNKIADEIYMYGPRKESYTGLSIEPVSEEEQR